MALPALSRNYFTRANVPFTTTASQILMDSFSYWALAHLLTDQLVTGTTGSTRHANSIWICRGSSDAVTGGAVTGVGVAGTNNWWNAGVFPGAFTRANTGTNHHWMLLENVTLGWELLLNFAGAGAGCATMSIGKSGCFSGGSVSAQPTPTVGVSIQSNDTAYNATDGGSFSYQFGTDFTNLGGTNYCHFTVADNGEFWFGVTRAGWGIFTLFWSLWGASGGNVADTTNNKFLICNDSTNSGRGQMGYSRMSTQVASCAGLTPGGFRRSSGGVQIPQYGGNWGVVTFATTDVFTSNYPTVQMHIMDLAPQYAYRGYLTDYLFGPSIAIGSSIPAVGVTQTRIILGDIIVPCMEVAPNM